MLITLIFILTIVKDFIYLMGFKIYYRLIEEPKDCELIYACFHNMKKLALLLISNSKLSLYDEDNNTALIYACKNKMENVILEIIKYEDCKPSHVDNSDITALMYLCINKMNYLALALINTGNSNTSQVSNTFKKTALIYASQYQMEDVVLKLISTNNCNPSQKDYNDMTALMYLCLNGMTTSALVLLEESDIDFSHISNLNKTNALYYASLNKMKNVTLNIIKLYNLNDLDIFNLCILNNENVFLFILITIFNSEIKNLFKNFIIDTYFLYIIYCNKFLNVLSFIIMGDMLYVTNYLLQKIILENDIFKSIFLINDKDYSNYKVFNIIFKIQEQIKKYIIIVQTKIRQKIKQKKLNKIN